MWRNFSPGGSIPPSPSINVATPAPPANMSSTPRRPSIITAAPFSPLNASPTLPPRSPSSNGTLKRMMCCKNIKPHKPSPALAAQSAPLLPQEPLDLAILDDFKTFAAGRFPDRMEDPARRIPWGSYIYIYGVVSFASRGSKAYKGIDFYAVSDQYGPEMIQIEEARLPEVVAKSASWDRAEECLVRMSAGLEFNCKKHLDTIYAVYLLKWKPAGKVFPRPPFDNMGRQPTHPLEGEVVPVPQKAPPRKQATTPKKQAGPRKIATPKKPSTPNKGSPRKGSSAPGGNKPSPKKGSPIKYYEEGDIGPNGEKTQKCSKHKKFMLETDFDINPKTGAYYGHCRRCMGRRPGFTAD